MNTKKEYSPIRMTLIFSALLIILATASFIISKTGLGALTIGLNQWQATENPLETKIKE